MTAWSMDLRARMIEAHEEGLESQQEIADRFGVSKRGVQKFLAHHHETGSARPKPHGGGQPAKIQGKAAERLKKAVRQQPDLTLEELLAILRKECGVAGSIMCVARALDRLDITRKKVTPAPRASE
jgi:putative transposase